MTNTVDLDLRARRLRWRTALGVTLAGLVILGAAAAIALSWRDQLPDPVASHWGVHGQVNGFASLNQTLGILLGIGGVLVLAFGALTGYIGQSAVNRRICAGVTIWSALWLSILTVGTLSAQRGIADARDANDVGGVIGVALAVSLVAAVLTAILVPGDPPRPTSAAVAADAPRVRLLGEERAVWIGRVSSPVGVLVGVPAAALVVAIAVATGLWWLLAEAAVLAALFLAMSTFVVRVGPEGVLIRSTFGLPRTHIPIDEVVRADVANVSPLRDFGGWGWRAGRGGRVGIVLRKGEALLVQRTGNRSVVVTVDHAATAAGLLNALADRSRQR